MNIDMGSVGDVINDGINYVEENVVDPIVEYGEDLVDWGEEQVAEIEEAIDDTIDFFVDNATDLAGVIEEFGEFVGDAVEKIGESIEETWGSFAESFEEICSALIEFADGVLDAFVDGFSDAWSWIEEKVDDAIDWLTMAAEKVYDFVVEEAIPWIVSLAELIPAIIKALGALLVLPLCYLYKEIFGEEEATILQGIAAHQPRLMEEFRVARLPVNRKYVVFSDEHMYVEGDFNFFGNNGNSRIYEHALGWHYSHGYHLIENGDVEDFWMRGGSSKGLILIISEQLPWPYFAELFESSAFQSATQVHAGNVFITNVSTYEKIRTLYHDRGKYTRLIGNHDDVWADPNMELTMQLFYPGIIVNDYCTLETTNNQETKVIMAHGHQADTFNNPLCNFAGKALTNLASTIHELTFGEWNMFSKSKDEWKKEWNGEGFGNELAEIDLLKFVSFSEYDLYQKVERIYGDSPSQPYLVLGHTHQPKDSVRLPDRIANWNEYSNSGTVGMWEEIVVGLEVEYPDVRVIAWRKEDDGTINRHELHSINYLGDGYLAAT